MLKLYNSKNENSLLSLLKNGYYIFLLFCYSIPAFPQALSEVTNSTIPKLNISPQSPEAASLGKYTDVPVGLYTGVPDISIPIYNITLKDIKVPITLSYHSAGIKVDEMASNVGLGWTLNCGGAISQSVNGLPDDKELGWLRLRPLDRFSQSHNYTTTWSYDGSWWDNDNWWQDADYIYLADALERNIDTQPDIYYVNYPGSSFKYFYSQEGALYTIPYKKIKFSDGAITDENDIVYEFKTTESNLTRYTYYNSTTPENFINSNTSYLTKIITPAGCTVSYEYEDYSYEFSNQPSETRYAQMPFDGTCSSALPLATRTESKTTITGKRVKRIITNTGIEVLFNYGLARIDLPGTAALTSIIMKDSSRPDIAAKTYTLTYDYFKAGSSTSADPNYYRLKLLSVEESGSKPWVLSYDEGLLPLRLSKAQDHWGYYNGNTGNGTLLPTNAEKGFGNGANRSPNPSVVTNGILKKITYPTGGNAAFDYEPNYAYSSYQVNGSFQSATLFAKNNSTVTYSFTVSNPDQATFLMSYDAGLANGTLRYYDPVTDDYGDCEVRLKDAQGNIVKWFYGKTDGWPSMQALQPGNYTFEIRTSGPGDQTNIFVSISWFTLPATVTSNKITGGVRIKSITNNGLTGDPIVKYFDYSKILTPEKSSGIQTYSPEYVNDHYVEVIQGSGQYRTYSDCKFYAQSSSSLMPLGTIQGGPVAYTEVSTYTGSKQEGCTHNRFTYGSSGPSGWEYPFAPVIAEDWANGLPAEVTEYRWDRNKSELLPVKKTISSYEFTNPANKNVVRGGVIALIKPPFMAVYDTNEPKGLIRAPEFKIAYFNLTSCWFYKKGNTEIIYDPVDTTKKVITATKYFYENPDHIQITRQEVKKSTGDTYKVYFRYPRDYNSAYAYNSNPLVEKRVVLSNSSSEQILSSEITTYKDHPGLFPLSYYSLKEQGGLASGLAFYNGGTPDPEKYEKRREYVYDGADNIVSFINDGHSRTSFIWGYSNQYPVAEIKNASENEFFHKNFEDEGIPGAAHTGDKYFNGHYNISWQLPNSRSYILSYWYRQSGSWHFKEAPYTGPVSIQDGDAVDDVNIFPETAQLSTYTYNPIIGLTSSIDAKGNTSYYEYDSLQRLKTIKNGQGKILKSFDYHYKP